MNKTNSSTSVPDSLILLIPEIPEIPAIPAVPSVRVFRSSGILTIRQGFADRFNDVCLDSEQAVKVQSAIGDALKTGLYLPPPAGEKLGYWEGGPSVEESQQRFAAIKEELKAEEGQPQK